MYCNGAKAEIEFSFLKPENHFAHLGYSAADCPLLGTEFSRGVWCPIKDSTECLFHAGLCSGMGGCRETRQLRSQPRALTLEEGTINTQVKVTP